MSVPDTAYHARRYATRAGQREEARDLVGDAEGEDAAGPARLDPDPAPTPRQIKPQTPPRSYKLCRVSTRRGVGGAKAGSVGAYPHCPPYTQSSTPSIASHCACPFTLPPSVPSPSGSTRQYRTVRSGGGAR
eukprot:2697871-Rhodomonas_salina.1